MNAGAPDEILAATHELLPLISREREATERGRRLAQPIVDALLAARLCRGAVSRELGGLALTTRWPRT